MKKSTLFLLIELLVCHSAFCGDDPVTLDLSRPTRPATFEVDPLKGQWVETYNTAGQFRRIEFDLFSFTHVPTGYGGTDVGDGMSYWDGFTYCTSGDTKDYGISGSSESWLTQQWGCMAGGGIKTDAGGKVLKDGEGKVQVEKGIPYLVAYWGYWVETVEKGDPCLQVNFTDSKLYEPEGVYVCNHPWPYYGNIHGDGFAGAFTKEGDFFKLIIHGYNEKKEDIGITVECMLAEFKDGKLHQRPDWQWVDLSELGAVSGLYFTLESSDMNPIPELGPNTAVYFCLDKLTVKKVKEDTTPSRPTGLKVTASETTLNLTWNESTGSAGVRGYNLYLNENEPVFTEEKVYTFTGLSPYTDYKIGVEAVATDGTLSAKASADAKTTDETAPSAPGNLQGEAAGNSIALTWDAATDNVAVTEYHIYLEGERQKRVNVTNYTLTGLDPATSYLIEVEARDAAANRSQRTSVTVMTKGTVNIPGTETAADCIRYHAATGTVHVQASKAVRLEVYDLSGTLLATKEVNAGDREWYIGHLPKGTYLLKCETNRLKITKWY